MTIRVSDIEVRASQQDPDAALAQVVADQLQVGREAVRAVRIDRKSLDARKKGRIVYRYRVDVTLAADEERVCRRYSGAAKLLEECPRLHPLDGLQRWSDARRPVVIGSGPAGTFAALVLSQAGARPILLERGEPVEQRLRTVGRLRRSGHLDPESNYCFGEGGAGTFSDGKLTCGRNHPLVRYLFEEWVRHGAPDSILYDAHPHIGTDYLLRVAKSMRDEIIALGGAVHFGTRVDALETGRAVRYRLRTSQGETFDTDVVVMAVGHSARDTYRMLRRQGVAMAPKPFAIGARVEHPQDVINTIQFGSCTHLPAAEYKLAARVQERGIWTFCMCPGGHLLPTSAQAGHLAINGMSYHARGSGFANAAVVVNVLREDFDRGDVLDGVAFQEALEVAAFRAGGGTYASPAQRLVDFLAARPSRGTLASTYRPGVVAGRLDKLLPEFVVAALQHGIRDYNKRMRGFVTESSVIVGVESKTSAPIVMSRSKAGESLSHPGLFPCGEGAGFAGGIVSAALDGVRTAQAVLRASIPPRGSRGCVLQAAAQPTAPATRTD